MHASKKIILTCFILVLLLNGYRCVSGKIYLLISMKFPVKFITSGNFNTHNQKFCVASFKGSKGYACECEKNWENLFVRDSQTVSHQLTKKKIEYESKFNAY